MSDGAQFTVTGEANRRKLAKQMPVVERFNAARARLASHLLDVETLQLGTPVLQARFDKAASLLREVAVDASAGLDATLEDPLTGFQVQGDPETENCEVKTGVYAE